MNNRTIHFWLCSHFPDQVRCLPRCLHWANCSQIIWPNFTDIKHDKINSSINRIGQRRSELQMCCVAPLDTINKLSAWIFCSLNRFSGFVHVLTFFIFGLRHSLGLMEYVRWTKWIHYQKNFAIFFCLTFMIVWF